MNKLSSYLLEKSRLYRDYTLKYDFAVAL